MIDSAITALVQYAVRAGLLEACDETWAVNTLLGILELSAYDPSAPAENAPLHELLNTLTDDAVRRGVIEDGIASRDLFDTRLMGALTPAPREVRGKFRALYALSPQAATDWFYTFSQNTNYIRRDRIAKDRKWRYASNFGTLDITINRSKPEKDPRAIAAAKNAAPSGYPLCQLCAENEGYFGRLDHPARENHRIVPLRLAGGDWYLQYSPYVYYNEHCIVLNARHVPMQISRATFDRLLDFVGQFPHYFLGSNADLPIVGGSILSPDHFQGGRYHFAMELAPIEQPLRFAGFPDIQAGIVRWAMSVLRLTGKDPARLAALAERILNDWRGYSDEAAFILRETDGEPHNTITPVARRRGELFELDLVLRNNLTTEQYPLGVYHPHPELHHIKKENIGLIEVMGLAVLPARLDTELAALRTALLTGSDLRADEALSKHADWAEKIQARRTLTEENIDEILRQEVGAVFAQVLADAGVYKCTAEGRAAFLRFAKAAGAEMI